jgi:hypothetical protein
LHVAFEISAAAGTVRAIGPGAKGSGSSPWGLIGENCLPVAREIATIYCSLILITVTELLHFRLFIQSTASVALVKLLL